MTAHFTRPKAIWTDPGTDLRRIVQLPVIDAESPIADLTSMFALQGGQMRLRPVQNRTLAHALAVGGLLGFVGVGQGKTLICNLLAVGLQRLYGTPANRIVLLLPPSLRAEHNSEWRKYRVHWQMPHGINVVTYAQLSRPESTNLFRRLQPQAIICDEADALKDPKSARTRRFLRYLSRHSVHTGGQVRLFALSGTLAHKSIGDWSHLAKYALGTGSPAPLTHSVLQTFCNALDAKKGFALFQQDDPAAEIRRSYQAVAVFQDEFGGKNLREGYQRRLKATQGVVVSHKSSCKAKIEITRRTLTLPAAVQSAYDKLRTQWELPDGTALESALDVYRHGAEISLGFWYEWIWPGGIVDREWMDTRQSWARQLRQWLPTSPVNADSPALVAALCREVLQGREVPVRLPAGLVNAWQAWEPHSRKPPPPTRPVWIDTFAVQDACDWLARQPTPGVVWAEQGAFGQAVAAVSGVKYFTAGMDQELRNSPAVPCVVQRKPHYRGKNMQAWHRMLITCPILTGAKVEQTIGRMHRDGQTALRVHVDINVHTDALDTGWCSAMSQAHFMQDNHGVPQKALLQSTTHGDAHCDAMHHELPVGWGTSPAGWSPVPAGWKRAAADLQSLLPKME